MVGDLLCRRFVRDHMSHDTVAGNAVMGDRTGWTEWPDRFTYGSSEFHDCLVKISRSFCRNHLFYELSYKSLCRGLSDILFNSQKSCNDPDDVSIHYSVLFLESDAQYRSKIGRASCRESEKI